MIILVGQLQPFKLPKENIVDMANEFAICILIYHLICLTDFVLDPNTRLVIGDSLILFVFLLIGYNLGLICTDSITKVFRRSYLEQQKAENIKNFLIWKRIDAYREKVK